MAIPLQTFAVARDTVVGVVTPDHPDQVLVLGQERPVPVHLAPCLDGS